MPLVVLLMGFGVTRNPTLGPLAASLRSGWLVVHVFFAWLAFGAYGLAAPLQLVRLDELIFRWILFGFIADTVMIASGAIWARDLWGSYWSWDPVETWSLLSFLVYGLVLHLRKTLGWRGRRIAWIVVGAIVTVIVTFWGVNLVMQGSAHVFNVG